jgi:NADPH:quinone reductase-like Zn-dependent oxidoreductase
LISVALCGGAEKGFSFHSPANVVTIGGIPMMFALVETDDPGFDSAAPENRRSAYLRTRAFSCNYRDRMLLAYFRHALPEAGFAFFGSDFVADVLAVGDDVTELSPGDRVIGNCAYPRSGAAGVSSGIPSNCASQCIWSAHVAKLVLVPSSMSDEIAAGFSVGAQTTYSLLRKLRPQAGDAVLITAARSNTSLFAIHALLAHGANVYALSTTRRAEERLLTRGVRKFFCVDFGAGSTAIANALRGTSDSIGGFDLIFDPFFDVYLAGVLPTIKQGGAYVTCGFQDQLGNVSPSAREDGAASLHDMLVHAIINNIRLVGSCLGESRDLLKALDDYSHGSFEVAIDSVHQGPEVGGYIERTFTHPDRFGKVVYRYPSD